MLETATIFPAEIDLIYEAALADGFYDTVLGIISQNLPECAVLIYGENTTTAKDNFLLHRGLGPDAIRSYPAGLSVQNVLFQAHWRLPEGRVFQDTELVDREVFANSPFYSEWLSQYGPLLCATGFVIGRNGERQTVLEVRYPEFREKQLRKKATVVLEALAPSVARAARIVKLRERHPLEDEYVASLLEVISLPAFIVDPDGRVSNHNTRAEVMSEKQNALFISADQFLHATSPDAEDLLKTLVKRMSTGRKFSSEIIALKKSDGEGSFFVAATLLDNGNSAGHVNCYETSRKSRVRILLTALDEAEPLHLSPEALWQAFRLSRAESQLAIALLEGKTIGECAQMYKVSKQTLRNQLTSVMRKTETHRQPQLVALLTRLAVCAPA